MHAATRFLYFSVVVIAQTLADRGGPGFQSNNPFYYFDIKLPQKFLEIGYAQSNWVSSPASIKTALGLLLEGASKNTATEICEALRLPFELTQARNQMYEFQTRLKRPSHGVEVKVANKIVLNKNLQINRSSKLNNANPNSGNIISSHDFSKPAPLTKELNSWVSEQTNNYITEIIQPGDITRSTGLLLLNAIYFKGEWHYGFNERHTKPGCFYSPQCNEVAMMFTSGLFKFGDVPNLHSQIIELPYKDPRYSMVIVLPYDNTSFKKMVEDLSFNNIPSILDRMKPMEADIRIPKFTVDFSIDLIPVLKKLGINDLFTDKADLSDLITSKSMVSGFLHKAKIEVNENGTIAGAATVVNVQLLSTSDKHVFEVNRPFFFFVRDSESGFLFDGQVVNPKDLQVNYDETEEQSIPLNSSIPLESSVYIHSDDLNPDKSSFSDDLKEEEFQLERERLELTHEEELIQLQIQERRRVLEFELDQFRHQLQMEVEKKRQLLKLKERHHREKFELEKNQHENS